MLNQVYVGSGDGTHLGGGEPLSWSLAFFCLFPKERQNKTLRRSLDICTEAQKSHPFTSIPDRKVENPKKIQRKSNQKKPVDRLTD